MSFKLVNVFFESQPNPLALFMRAVITAAAKTDDWGADLMNSEPPRREQGGSFFLATSTARLEHDVIR